MIRRVYSPSEFSHQTTFWDLPDDNIAIIVSMLDVESWSCIKTLHYRITTICENNIPIISKSDAGAIAKSCCRLLEELFLKNFHHKQLMKEASRHNNSALVNHLMSLFPTDDLKQQSRKIAWMTGASAGGHWNLFIQVASWNYTMVITNINKILKSASRHGQVTFIKQLDFKMKGLKGFNADLVLDHLIIACLVARDYPQATEYICSVWNDHKRYVFVEHFLMERCEREQDYKLIDWFIEHRCFSHTSNVCVLGFIKDMEMFRYIASKVNILYFHHLSAVQVRIIHEEMPKRYPHWVSFTQQSLAIYRRLLREGLNPTLLRSRLNTICFSKKFLDYVSEYSGAVDNLPDHLFNFNYYDINKSERNDSESESNDTDTNKSDGSDSDESDDSFVERCKDIRGRSGHSYIMAPRGM